MAANKITAYYGADVSEIEAKMLQATRATKYYENAVKKTNGLKVAPDLTASLAKSNEQIAKGVMLLRGGAIGAGVGFLLSQMKMFSEHAKDMGKSATDAQKSAAKWGEELNSLGESIKGLGASALGTLAGWGRSTGELFRDPVSRSYDAVAESSEKAAKRQEEALARVKAAHKKAAEEIPELNEKLADLQKKLIAGKGDGNERDMLVKDRKAIEDRLRAIQKSTKSGGAEMRAEALKLEIKLVEILLKLQALQKTKKAEAEKKTEERIKKEAALQKEMTDHREKLFDRYATLEQRIARVIRDGRKAQQAFDKKSNEENALALWKQRDKYRDLVDEQKELNEQKAKGVAIDTGRNADGYFTTKSGRVKVSDADRARADITRAVTARRSAEATSKQVRSRGSDEAFAGGTGASTANASEKTLKEIAGYLKPKA